jgi:hypothetical protein
MYELTRGERCEHLLPVSYYRGSRWGEFFGLTIAGDRMNRVHGSKSWRSQDRQRLLWVDGVDKVCEATVEALCLSFGGQLFRLLCSSLPLGETTLTLPTRT